MASYRSEPFQPLMIHLSSDSSASSAGPAPPPIHGRGFIRTCAVPHRHGCARGGERGDDAGSSFGNGYLPFDGSDSTRRADDKDSPFWLVIIGLSFS